MGVEINERLNMVVRRESRENNFKAVLETLRVLVDTGNADTLVPSWLHSLVIHGEVPKMTE